MIPGEYLLNESPIEANSGRPVARILVKNPGDRPVQVGSHYHFFEVNRLLAFDRAASFGMHLNIPAGTAVRFEPGEEKEIELTPFAGARLAHGCNGLVEGSLDGAGARDAAVANARSSGFQFSSDKKSK